ncbi:protein-L-isoaspartate O-methyltransferase family protein [Halovivax gelatinilyticus]|uniref:protein-L-isoaspartate O-methyltransferase family protein n=1 Tax=Halovivax gelatinilyticus TaxID=2961597 RepID=UPI0020CA82C8|nr:protein-L-isoaspartate O-methyltransferase [Halovivax gelatinilyticus]
MDPAVVRADMIEGLQHESKGVLTDASLAAAMQAVPREAFVPDGVDPYADREYDHLGTTVLAPSDVARLLEALSPEPDDSVLVVGAGVGYTSAVLAELVGETNVHAVDIARPAVYAARSNLAEAGYDGVLVDCRDGVRGLPAYAPFDRILLEASAVAVPDPLRAQLADGGRLVFPCGTSTQRLLTVTSTGRVEHGPVSFEPLLVRGEQSGAIERNRTMREDGEFALQRAGAHRGWEHEWIEWESD